MWQPFVSHIEPSAKTVKSSTLSLTLNPESEPATGIQGDRGPAGEAVRDGGRVAPAGAHPSCGRMCETCTLAVLTLMTSVRGDLAVV